MATESRRPDFDVSAVTELSALTESACTFEFFQAVRLLKRMCERQKTPGGFDPPSSEFVRFSSHQSAAFPASQIQALASGDHGGAVMVVNFMGLTGPLGALPLAYTAFVMDRLLERDATAKDFFDIFNHRIISLFYRAWEKYRFAVAYESGERGTLSRYVLDLLGLGTSGLQNRLAVPDETLVYYSGLMAQRPLSATALRQVLADYFDVPVEIEQFAGAWYPLDIEDRCSLDDRPKFSSRLGKGVVVGDEVWYQQSRVRIKLGPLSLEEYLDFLPGGGAYEPLRAFTNFFAGQEFDFEAQLILRREETPPCVLGEEGTKAPQLGWVTWMNTAGMNRHPGDTVLRL